MKNRILEFIFNHITNDQTQRAIMLSSPWGTGKSFFITKQLSSYLKSKDFRCVVVSLYGLNDLYDLSRSIFIETRFDKFKSLGQKSIGIQTAKIIGTTVLKGVASVLGNRHGISINITENQLKKLYQCLDLTKTLLVFEDLERSEIDIKKVLGFVNNLTEHDGAKVLLVANEEQLLKKENKMVNDKQMTVFTQQSEEYLSIKEKTVGDTIYFDGVDEEVLKDIVTEFKSPVLNKIAQADNKVYSTILKEIMQSDGINCSNLRAFKFACQKTIDIFRGDLDKFDHHFLLDVFLGNIAFCLRKSERDNLSWDTPELTSISLGTAKHPLFKIGYWYIQNNYLPSELKEEQYFVYEATKKKEYRNKIVNVLYNYFESSDKELSNALKELTNEIQCGNISLHEYSKIGNYLISIKENIPIYAKEVDALLDDLIASMNRAKDLPSSAMLISGIQLLSKDAQDEYARFSKSFNDHLQKKSTFFDYTSESLAKFDEYIRTNFLTILADGAFASKFDIDKFSSFLQSCSARDISFINGIFRSVYRHPSASQLLQCDFDSLVNLKKKIEDILKLPNHDNVAKMQLRFFVGNLENVLNLLKS